MDSVQEIGRSQNCWEGLEKRLSWGELWARQSRTSKQVGTVLTDEGQHLEMLMLEMAASGIASCVCSLENRQPLHYGTFIYTATELVTGHWHAAADSHSCQERQPEDGLHLSLLCKSCMSLNSHSSTFAIRDSGICSFLAL